MLKTNFLRLLSLVGLLAIAGCCANNSCNCQDELADALYFSFQLGGTGGFQASDVDTVLLVRTTRPVANSSALATTDSKLLILPLTSNGLSLKRDSVVINNASPFATSGSNIKISAYDYRIIAYRIDQVAGKKVKTQYVFKVNNIALKGRFNANGCCTCYENTGKQATITTVAADTLTATAQDFTAPPLQPIVVTLKKS